MTSLLRFVAAAGIVLCVGTLAFAPAGADPDPQAPATPPVPEYCEISLADGIAGGVVGQTDAGVRVSLGGTAKAGFGVGLKRTVTDAEGRWEEMLAGTISPEETAALVDAIAGLWKLPVEDPKGGEDVYGLATMVQVRVNQADGLHEWKNSFPNGCTPGAGPSQVKPTDEEKKVFRAVVARIKETVTKHATEVKSRMKK